MYSNTPSKNPCIQVVCLALGMSVASSMAIFNILVGSFIQIPHVRYNWSRRFAQLYYNFSISIYFYIEVIEK